MRTPLKTLSSVLTVLMLLLASAACNGKETSNAGGAGEEVVLEYWHTYSDEEEVILKEKIKPLFEKEHPGIKLKLTRMPYEGLKQQVIAGVGSGEAPDLMRMDIIWVPEFAKMGALQEVSKFDGFDEIKDKQFKTTMSTNAYNSGYYGLPIDTNTKIAIYNKKLLKKAGLSEAPKTMGELADASRTLVEKGELGGIGIGGPNSWSMLPYFWSLGGKLTNDDFTKVDGYLNSQESIKALETLVSWHEEGLISPTIIGKEPGTWDGMKHDEYLMIDDGPWFYSVLMNDKKAKRDVMEYTIRGLIPEGPGGSHSVIGGQNLVTFVNSEHPKEAWTFMKWMASKEPQLIMGETGLIPTNKEAANDPKFLETPFAEEYVQQLETALPRTPIPQWAEMEEILNLNFEKAIRGKMTPEEALEDATKKIKAVMN
ncbi:carbohydrate ABC transporter substrate-binding protein (CUT1 family) [Melghirimyces profundicolus]|uniref:Carbohydrate ABC transporter substrate-binding protein (CUT1 family) n=1 Tax=Melghirimyces profundicolus TaxID=1242148 RepID=A0A2T6BZ30_9BACL|nr:extracellular solute-binding protein [Melghirimyces profundicolus]PTX61323.1 carbohydrate ABC transporter substrate-binding protein (CUT1 family) [Melghirimyces profundicolus]